METLRGVAKLCYYVSNSEQTTVSGVLHGDRRGSRRKTAVVFKQFGVRMRKSHLENMVRYFLQILRALAMLSCYEIL